MTASSVGSLCASYGITEHSFQNKIMETECMPENISIITVRKICPQDHHLSSDTRQSPLMPKGDPCEFFIYPSFTP